MCVHVHVCMLNIHLGVYAAVSESVLAGACEHCKATGIAFLCNAHKLLVLHYCIMTFNSLVLQQVMEELDLDDKMSIRFLQT